MASTRKLLKLDSVTLRGVGSYFHGAELKIHPLTILCGKNGSGKSTWFNVLTLLQRSLSKGMLPFDFDATDMDCHDMQLTNARVNMTSLTELSSNEAEDRRYGPWGTIGICSTAIHDGELGDLGKDVDWPSTHPAAQLLRSGMCQKGSRFRLRLAHSSQGMMEYHQDLVELVWNDVYVIRMVRPRPCTDSANRPYTLECSRAFFCSEPDADDEVVEVMTFQPPYGPRSPDVVELHTSLPEEMSPQLFLNACIRLIRDLSDHTLRGFSLVTAVRDRQDISSLDPSVLDGDVHQLIEELKKPFEKGTPYPDLRTSEQLMQTLRDHINRIAVEDLVHSRYVGPHGEGALYLWRRFSENGMYDPGLPFEYTLTRFVHYWLNRLLQVGVFDSSDLPSDISKPLCGYLCSTNPAPPAPFQWPEGTTWEDLRRFTHPCFPPYQSQGPSRLSSGFHQLMPVIMQAALLLPGEIVAIENPEVHLHPSLQLGVAEFLMHQALGGKTLIVETHSDLIIRRLIRAVLREEIKQEALSMQFVSLTNAEEYACSKLESLQVNDQGQIENWPPGFLDDDIKESRRLFEIMYGTIPETDAE